MTTESVPSSPLADRVREMRLARRWSQADLARAAGLSRVYVKKIEDGRAQEPSARTLGRLCVALQADVVEFMQLCQALPDEYRDPQFREELDIVMYLRRQRRLSEQFVNTLMQLIRLAEAHESIDSTE